MRKKILFGLFVVLLACSEKDPSYNSLIGKWRFEADGVVWLNGQPTSNTGHAVVTFEIIADPNKASDTLFVQKPFVTYAGTTSSSMGSQIWKIKVANGLYEIPFDALNSLAINANQLMNCHADTKFTTIICDPQVPFAFSTGSWLGVGGYDGTTAFNVLVFDQTITIRRIN